MNKDLMANIVAAAALIAVALAATLARKLGYVDSETVTRLVTGAIGLMVAWYGNRMPKAFAPSEVARRVARVGGWSQVLSGLVYAGLWVFAPIPVALVAGCSVIVAGIAVPFGYCLWLARRARSA